MSDPNAPRGAAEQPTPEEVAALRLELEQAAGLASRLSTRLLHLEAQVGSWQQGARPAAASAEIAAPAPMAAAPALADTQPEPRPLPTPAPTGTQPGQPLASRAPVAARPLAMYPPRRAPAPEAAEQPEVSDGQRRHNREVAVGQKWLLIAGVIMIVLGMGYFLKYSFDQDWIGPAGRVALAFVAGGALLGAGERFRAKDMAYFGLALIGGGIATLYFSVFAAFQIYDLIGQLPAFGLMVLVTSLAAALALHYDTRWLAVLGIVGGFVTPVLLSTGNNNEVGLMTYMLILGGGVLAISRFKRWALLNHLGFLFTWALFAGWFAKYYNDDAFWMTFAYATAFFLIWALGPFLYYFRQQEGVTLKGFGVTLPNAFIAFGFSWAMLDTHFHTLPAVSVVTVAYAALFFGLAQALHRRHPGNQRALIMLLSQGILFLVITVPLMFSDQWVTFFWAAQAAVLLWATLRLEHRWLYRASVALMWMVAGKLIVYDYPEVWGARGDYSHLRDGWLHGLPLRMMTVAAVLGAVYAAARLLSAAAADKKPQWVTTGGWAWAGFATLLFMVLNIEVSALVHDLSPRAIPASISVLWALFSLGLMAIGFARNLSVCRKVSLGLFAVAALKVLVVDMQQASTPFRIISTIALGLLLVGAAYLYYQFKERILPEDPDDSALARPAHPQPEPDAAGGIYPAHPQPEPDAAGGIYPAHPQPGPELSPSDDPEQERP